MQNDLAFLTPCQLTYILPSVYTKDNNTAYGMAEPVDEATVKRKAHAHTSHHLLRCPLQYCGRPGALFSGQSGCPTAVRYLPRRRELTNEQRALLLKHLLH